MSEDLYAAIFGELISDIRQEDNFPNRRPLLAHYTSLTALERILTTEEIWFSNPLYMNDLEEVRFGVLTGAEKLRNSDMIKRACGSEHRHASFIQAFDHYLNDFDQTHLFDTYVFCLSEHTPGDNDGLLSMWRGYGGNGKGAAIIFDSARLNALEQSPLILSRVEYGSTDERIKWLDGFAQRVAQLLQNHPVTDKQIYLVSHAVFERLKLFALFSKHIGFKEEREWRVVYLPERDTNNALKHMLGYINSPRGIEPKLKFKIAPVTGLTALDLSFEKIVVSIHLGPTTSSPLAKRSVERMLEVVKKPVLKDRLVASSIPYRTNY